MGKCSKKVTKYNVLHICDYAAAYRGNFIDSLCSLEKYHGDVNNFYLFPNRAQNNSAKEWITEMNKDKEVAYIQKSNFFSNALLLSNLIKKHKINRIVRHFSDFKMDILVRMLFGGKNVIRFFHCDCERPKSALKFKISEMVWKNNKLVGVSDAVTEHIKNIHKGFSAYSIVNAICFDRLDVVDEYSKPDGIALLMMGWAYEIKGVDLAVKAASALRERYDIKLQISGGKNEDKIKELVKDILGYEADWIIFLPPTNNVGTYYKNNDIFLSPSRREAFGYANIEAAYCKNSIVLSKVDGQGELNIEGAYWIKRDDVEDFKEKLELAIIEYNTPEKTEQKERAKQQVEKTYSLQTWSDKLYSLLINI